MGSLTALINVARSALIADQAALNVTSNNVANQNTTGYTREVATFTSGDYVTLNGTQEASSGPTVAVSSERNLALERQIQTLQQSVSSSTAEGGVLTQIEDIFGVASSGSSAGSTQIGVALDALFSSFTALAANPSDSATRQGVIGAAQTLATSLNSAANQFSELTTSLNQQAQSTVEQVNALTQTVATLNSQIAKLSPNSDAGTLEDQRQTAIEQLSQYIGLTQTTNVNDNTITLTTRGGTALVVGQQSYNLQESNTGTGTAQILDNTGKNITAGVTGGSLGGLLAGVNTDVPSAVSQLNSIATAIVNQVNTINEGGSTLTGAAGGALFTITGSVADSASGITAASDPAIIAAAASGAGTSDNTNANALAALATTTNASQTGPIQGQTFDGFYASLLSQVGNSAASLNSETTANQTALTQLTTQRDSYSSVNLDEEAANLTQYQRSYEAASKVFTIADSIYASALNLGVESSVS
ncbi:flagellar hook-associated protein 1 FlgK [Granulicella rosea]|uniref:Flagellar hook-associated protein 1 n=1 Tax=Granulicella rosea TaxID=474952 RepID=A0A239H2C6_9BACT|nr:flagellar hook-associated protein FlgK [Granulicella rosea]SNS75569.1 flagellar hook-associated protein 1 FlgK [Granulicella rosea]